MRSLDFLSIAEAAALISARELSPVDLVRAQLDRIDQLDGGLKSFITLLPDRALAAAREAEVSIGKGRYLGPLHGIPVALKDAYDTAGVRTTVGSRLLADNVPVEDAFAWARLRAAGAILLGKLETTEFCYGGPSTDGLFPPARNPWDPSRYAGGSSSGAGVALAAGLCLGALGTDTGGSARLPAAYCGVTGMVVSAGLVGRSGVFPLSRTFDRVGPMARSAEDCAIILEALLGHDPGDPDSLERPPVDYRGVLRQGVRGLKLGCAPTLVDPAFVSAPMIRAFDEASRTFEDLGASVVQVDLPPLTDFAACQMVITVAEGLAIHEADLRTRRDAYTYLTRMRLSLGSMLGAFDYVQAQRLRGELSRRYDAAFAGCDALLLPGAPDVAPKAAAVGAFDWLRKPLVTVPANVVGAPAIALPAGFTDGGLPLSIQVMGPRWGEAIVFRVAHAFQDATPWHTRRPPL